jgi:D-aspartate ligase
MVDQREGNPSRAEPDWPAVVIGGAYYTGKLLMRDLSRRGLSACCIDNDPSNVGFRSIYGKAYACPNPDAQPTEWLEFMIALAKRFDRKPVFIASADIFVTALSCHARELADFYIFHETGVYAQSQLATKEEQYALASRHGMPIPRTCDALKEQDVIDFAEQATFPCLLKPLHCREWEEISKSHSLYGKKLITATSRVALLASYRRAAEIDPKVVLQEVIEGPDTAKVVYLSCYARDGQRIACCVLRELRCSPIYFGSASVV